MGEGSRSRRRAQQLREFKSNGRLRLDILRDRLESLPLAEFKLLAALALDEQCAVDMWVNEACPDGEEFETSVALESENCQRLRGSDEIKTSY